MGRVAHIPYAVGQDEDGAWCAHAYVGRVGCNGNGDTREEVLADLREAVVMVLEDDGVPEEFAIMTEQLPAGFSQSSDQLCITVFVK